MKVEGPREDDGGSNVEKLKELVRSLAKAAERAPTEPAETNEAGRAGPVVLQMRDGRQQVCSDEVAIEFGQRRTTLWSTDQA